MEKSQPLRRHSERNGVKSKNLYFRVRVKTLTFYISHLMGVRFYDSVKRELEK